MEKFLYDNGIDDALGIIESRIEYYDCLIRFDKADIIKFEIIEELEMITDLLNKLKYY